MSPSALDPALAELLDSRRLGTSGELSESRQRFTVSREEALMRLREQTRARSGSRWAWTLWLVRAANALSELAEASVSVEQVEGDAGEQRVTIIDVITPGVELEPLELGDLLAGALAPDIGLAIGEVEASERFARFRVLIGRALNGALAHEPVSIELETVAGGRRFERREQPVDGRDPYAERKTGGCVHASRFIVRLRETQPGLSSRLGRWLRGRGQVDEELAKLWAAHAVSDEQADADREASTDGVPLGPRLGRAPVELGAVACYWPRLGPRDPESEADATVWLIRDGLRILDIGPALASQQFDPRAASGFVDCPALRLTADESGVVLDAKFEQLIAWLSDYRWRIEASDAAFAWPRSLAEGVQAADGRTITVDELAESAHRGRELVHVWRHQASTVPAWARSRIAALWPAEELLLRQRLPELRLVPLRALGQTDVDPADLTSLRAGCFEPIALVKDSPVELPDTAGSVYMPASVVYGTLQVSVEAYVHRAPTASTGFIVILAYERRVAQLHETGQVFPGLTLICRVTSVGPGASLDVAVLRRDQAVVAAIAELCRAQTRRHWEAVLTHVMSRAKPWENPLLRSCLLELRAQTLELRYGQTEHGLRLCWRDTTLLDVELGRGPDGARKTLRDALRNVRARGFVLVAHPHKPYRRLKSNDPLLQPWVLDDDASRGLLGRVIGAAAILDMPVVPEVHPLVREDPVEDQRHLVRERKTVERDLGQSSTDRRARMRLLGHLLVARAIGGATMGLDTIALLERYDPRAQHPTRLVSLATVLAERPRPGLVPLGAVDRSLPRPMLEVDAGVAALLAEVEDFEPGLSGGAAASTISASAGAKGREAHSERSASTPVRRRGRAAPPLLVRMVAGPLAVGQLQVASDASSVGIALWGGGLRVGEIALPEPLGRVGGRLVLTATGQRIGAAKIRELATTEARAAIADAPRQRILLPPGGDARVRLDHFVAYVRSVLRVEDRFGLGQDFGLVEAKVRGDRALALRDMSLRAAPLRPLRQRDALLVEVVRQSLAMQVRFDTAMLSWRPAKVSARQRDGAFEIEFGLRNGWVRRGLDEDRKLSGEQHRRAALFAGLFVVGAFFEQVRARDEVDLGAEHLVVALWRLLQLV